VGTEAVAASLSADAAIVAEPTELQLAVAHRGFVHVSLEFRSIPHVKLTIELPEGAVVERFEDQEPKAPDWAGNDPAATRALGDRWATHSLALGLSVPSVLSSSERNVLLRATSPEFSRLKVVETQEFLYDERMWKAEARGAAEHERVPRFEEHGFDRIAPLQPAEEKPRARDAADDRRQQEHPRRRQVVIEDFLYEAHRRLVRCVRDQEWRCGEHHGAHNRGRHEPFRHRHQAGYAGLYVRGGRL